MVLVTWASEVDAGLTALSRAADKINKPGYALFFEFEEAQGFWDGPQGNSGTSPFITDKLLPLLRPN